MGEILDIYGKNVAGKVGTVSFYVSRGKTIMRSLPGKRVHQMTANQLRNQHRFQEIRKFCGLFKTIVIPQIWNNLATTSSGYHLFMKTNSPAFDQDGILADPMKIRLSMGKLSLPEGIQAQRTSPGGSTIRVQWEKETDIGGLTFRQPLIVISAGEGKYSDMIATGLTRKTNDGTFELPELAVPATHIYLFFESIDQRYYSESVCIQI